MPSANWRMADRLCDGRLLDIIRDHTTDGLSPDAIASRLFADHGVEVTGRTVRRWIDETPIISVRSGDGPTAA